MNSNYLSYSADTGNWTYICYSTVPVNWIHLYDVKSSETNKMRKLWY